MPKQRKGGRPESGRITITVRLSPKLKSLLDDAAEAAGLDKSAYVREALVRKLKKDGHIKKKRIITKRKSRARALKNFASTSASS